MIWSGWSLPISPSPMSLRPQTLSSCQNQHCINRPLPRATSDGCAPIAAVIVRSVTHHLCLLFCTASSLRGARSCLYLISSAEEVANTLRVNKTFKQTRGGCNNGLNISEGYFDFFEDFLPNKYIWFHFRRRIIDFSFWARKTLAFFILVTDVWWRT